MRAKQTAGIFSELAPRSILVIGGHEISRVTSTWNDKTLTNLNIPHKGDCERVNDVRAIIPAYKDSVLPSHLVGNYDLDKNNEIDVELVKKEIDLLAEWKLDAAHYPLLKEIRETSLSTKSTSDEAVMELSCALLKQSGLHNKNGYEITQKPDHRNHLTVTMGPNQATIIPDIVAWKSGGLISTVMVQNDPRTWHYPGVAAQLLADAAYDYAHGKEKHGIVEACCISVSGWFVKICKAEFPVSYFEDLKEGVTPTQAPKVQVWFPDEFGSNLLQLQGRKTVMNALNAISQKE